MRTLSTFLLAAAVAQIVTALPARAQAPADSPLLRLSLAQGPQVFTATVPDPAPATRPAAEPSVRDVDAQLTLNPPAGVTYMPLGTYRTGIEPWLYNPAMPPSTHVRDTVEAIRAAHTSGTGPFDALGNLFDVGDQDERPWSTTTTVRLRTGPAAVGQWVPFAAIAREEGALQDRERVGVGGGMAFYLAPSASIASEMLYFGDRGNSNNAWERETRFSLRFMLEF